MPLLKEKSELKFFKRAEYFKPGYNDNVYREVITPYDNHFECIRETKYKVNDDVLFCGKKIFNKRPPRQRRWDKIRPPLSLFVPTMERKFL